TTRRSFDLLSNKNHCLHTAWEADFFSVVYNLTYRRNNGGSSAQTAFCEFRYFFKEDFSFFYFHSQVFLSYIFQRTAGDRRQDTVGFWCYQLVVLGDEDKVGTAGFFYFCSGGSVQIHVFIKALVVSVYDCMK